MFSISRKFRKGDYFDNSASGTQASAANGRLPNKVQLRTKLLQQLRQQREEERRRRSKAIWRKVARLTAFRKAATVCCYAALSYEVQTRGMIEAMLARGKRVVVPVAQPKQKKLWLCEIRNPSTELKPGTHGVPEPAKGIKRPVQLKKVDLVLVPGVAFDRKGRRLGHGHGYFDRFLARLPKQTPSIGLAYRFQLLDRLPVSAHDRAVGRVLTA